MNFNQRMFDIFGTWLSAHLTEFECHFPLCAAVCFIQKGVFRITEWLGLASWSHLVLCTYQNYPKPGDLTRLFDTAYLECELQQEFRCPRIRFVRNTPFAWLRIISLIGPVLVNGMRAIINQHAHSSCQFCWLKSWRWNHLELATRIPICDDSVIQ